MQIAALRAALGDLDALLQRRADRLTKQGRASGARWERVRQLRQHLAEYLLPRVQNLDAPLVAVIIGSTGAGKSSLINTLAGRKVSPSGVLRPTTRRPVVVATADDAKLLAAGELLPGLAGRDGLEIVQAANGARSGVMVIDAPDVDSVEAQNRAVAGELLEAADLCIVVTTAARYADQVPWQVLERARQRGLPLLTVLNRLPADQEDADAIATDYRRLLGRGGLDASGADGKLEVVTIAEGAVDRKLDALDASAAQQVTDSLDRLASSKRRRQQLAQRAFQGAIQGLATAIHAIAEDAETERTGHERLLQDASTAYGAETTGLVNQVKQGTFLRAEVVRQWQEFVGGGQVARLLATGIGRITSRIGGLFRSSPAAPTEEVERAAFDDLAALAIGHAHEAARRTSTAWSSDPSGARALETHPELWANAGDFEPELRAGLERWIGEIGALIGKEGEGRRGFARAASLSVNAIGVSLMLAAFGTTGGLTGAEFGIAAATALVNQRLLEAIFGEATLRNLVSRARVRLLDVLTVAMERDRLRFEAAVEPFAPDRALAGELRAVAERLAQAAA